MSVSDWIAVDWGTTHVRAWAMDRDDRVLAHNTSDKGMGVLQPDEFEAALLELVSPWLAPDQATQILACGMVGARQGWTEADYLAVPTPPLMPVLFQEAPAADARLVVSIIPGLKQLDPPDVMRGEETQIAGFLSETPGFEGVVVMPGTHTKWVRVAEGKVLAFSSFMTGEVFSLLEHHSVLRHSLVGDGIHSDLFEETVMAVLADPGRAVSGLFRLRADDLLHGRDRSALRAQLSAYLIGSELSAASEYWRDGQCVVIGAPHLTELYRSALAAGGCAAHAHPADALTLKGLCAAKTLLRAREG